MKKLRLLFRDQEHFGENFQQDFLKKMKNIETLIFEVMDTHVGLEPLEKLFNLKIKSLSLSGIRDDPEIIKNQIFNIKNENIENIELEIFPYLDNFNFQFPLLKSFIIQAKEREKMEIFAHKFFSDQKNCSIHRSLREIEFEGSTIEPNEYDLDIKMAKKINIQKNNFASLFSLNFSNFQNLTHAFIENDSIQNIEISTLNHLQKITIICSSLVRLSLKNCVRVKFFTLKKSFCLKFFCLETNNFQNFKIDCFNLEHLSLCGVFTYRVLESFKICKNLKIIEIFSQFLENNNYFPRQFFIKLPNFFPDLRVLNINNCKEVSLHDLQYISNLYRIQNIEKNKNNVSIFLDIYGQFYPQNIPLSALLLKQKNKTFTSVYQKMKNLRLFKFFNTWRLFRLL